MKKRVPVRVSQMRKILSTEAQPRKASLGLKPLQAMGLLLPGSFRWKDGVAVVVVVKRIMSCGWVWFWGSPSPGSKARSVPAVLEVGWRPRVRVDLWAGGVSGRILSFVSVNFMFLKSCFGVSASVSLRLQVRSQSMIVRECSARPHEIRRLGS